MAEMGASACKLLVFIILFGASSAAAAGVSKDPETVAKWVYKTQFAKQKVTKLHFFFHDTGSGKNPTALPIAKSAGNNSVAAFGTLIMADDPLTVSPHVNSTTIGYARGLYGNDARKDIGMVMVMNFVFTSGKYNESTLAMVGHNAAMESPREMPILGGTGLFRLARGVAIANTYYTKGFDVIVEYNVAFLH
uniref:Dirigent protein n=1 Tax=Kalanchoe fedtschenkoi TaxID=63787 RepID=A0A7N0UYX4_KALFE